MAQLVLAFIWGIVSDRCGRKPLIVMSNLFSTISMLMFGLAGNYTAAALARILGGACVPPPCMTALCSKSTHVHLTEVSASHDYWKMSDDI